MTITNPSFTLLAASLLIAAGTSATHGADHAARPKVTIDTSQLVDLPAWAAQAGRLVEEWHPKVAEILGVPATNAPAIRLVIKEVKGVAATSGNTITVSADWVRQHPEDIGLIIHELTHIVQAYPRPEPGWLVEGIADYVRFWHYEKTPQTRINKEKASYRDSYRTTGAFLAWLDKQHPGTVKKLNAALRKGDYKEALFQETTGKPAEILWKEFIQQWENR